MSKIKDLSQPDIADLLAGKASPRVTKKYEACLVSKEQPISKPQAYAAFASAIGLKHQLRNAADLEKAFAGLVDRVVFPDSVKERPKSCKALMECVASLSSRDQRVLFEQTRRAEDKRVLEVNTSNLLGVARDALNESRRDEAEDGRRRDVEALRDLLNLGFDVLRGEYQRAFEGDVRVSYLPSHVVDDHGPVYVKYKGDHRVELKAGP